METTEKGNARFKEEQSGRGWGQFSILLSLDSLPTSGSADHSVLCFTSQDLT